KAFIKLAKPWKPDEWKAQGKARFLDLRTLGWALFNRSFSLKTLCEQLKAEHRKIDHEPTGEVTGEEIEYARLDGRCTVDGRNGFNFSALVQPDNDILPIRTVYDGVSQNIGNNCPTSETPLWFAGCDLIASNIRTGKAPKILRAIRMVPYGKQAGMNSVSLRGSMVEIDPYKDDLFRKVIEQRKLNKSDKALYYWLKIFANSIYGFFVELLPVLQTK